MFYEALKYHAFNENRQEMLDNSYLDCHVKGLHSIMLYNTPGKVIRMYVTSREHNLWQHTTVGCMQIPNNLAFHPHRYNLTLMCVAGKISHITLKNGKGGYNLPMYRYSSALADGSCGFVNTETMRPFTPEYRWLLPGRHISLHATCVHSLLVPQGTVAAWMIMEGAENPEYEPVAFTTMPLEEFKPEGFYRKMTEKDMAEILESIGVFI